MKKLLCVLFVLLVLFMSIPCVASALTEEEYKQQIRAMFADAPDEDLKSLFEAVQYELMCRGYKFNFDETHQAASPQKEASNQKEVKVPAGKYTVGDDIPAGTYTITYDGKILASVTVKSSAEKYLFSETLSTGQKIGKLELSDGQIVEVGYDPVIFMPYQGLGF